jgi:hypothetical protein
MRAVCSVAVIAACSRPSPIVICHNGNCATNDVSRDDTIEALDESLALTFDGRPVLDGVELDTFWFAAESRCIFAHDLDGDTSISVSDAAAHVGDHLATHTNVSWNGERFYTFLELKGFVGDSFDDRHTPLQFEQHADCALEAARRIASGARDGGHPLTIGFIAGVPRHHETLVTRAGWTELIAMDVEVMLIGDIFAPYSSIVPELSDFKVPLDAAEYHPDYLTPAQAATYASYGIELVQWSFITTSEALTAIEKWEPSYAITNEAMLLRRWIER